MKFRSRCKNCNVKIAKQREDEEWLHIGLYSIAKCRYGAIPVEEGNVFVWNTEEIAKKKEIT